MLLPSLVYGLVIGIGGILIILGLVLVVSGLLGLRATPLNRAQARHWRNTNILAGLMSVLWGSLITGSSPALYIEMLTPSRVGLILFVVFFVSGIALLGGWVVTIRAVRADRSFNRPLSQDEPPHDA
jgi:hypothetical protein